MEFDRYDIFFSAKFVKGYDPAKVKQTVAQVFRANAAQLEILFSGESVRIKQSVDAETAGQYRAALLKAGILVDIRPSSATVPEVRRSQPEPPPPLAGLEVSEDGPVFELLPANTGSLADCAPPMPPPPDVDLDGLVLAAPGTLLAPETATPVVQIDTGDLSALPPNTGSLEDCVVEKTPRRIPDITHLKVVDD